MAEKYLENNNCTILDPGIYLRSSNNGVFTWDLRLILFNDNTLITDKVLHSLEHLLIKLLKDALGDNFVGVFPTSCKTGMTILTKENWEMYDDFQGILLKVLSNILDNINYIPFRSEKYCGHPNYHDLDGVKKTIDNFFSKLLRNFLFLCPLECEYDSLKSALSKYFGSAVYNYNIIHTGIGKANVANSLGLNLHDQSYVVLAGFANTNHPELHQGDIVFPLFSEYGDVYDEFGILLEIRGTNELTGKDDIIISTNDSFATNFFLKNNVIRDHYIFDMETNALASVLKTHYSDRNVKLIAAKMISNHISSESQDEDFNTFKDKQDFSLLLMGSLQLSEYFARIEYDD